MDNNSMQAPLGQQTPQPFGSTDDLLKSFINYLRMRLGGKPPEEMKAPGAFDRFSIGEAQPMDEAESKDFSIFNSVLGTFGDDTSEPMRGGLDLAGQAPNPIDPNPGNTQGSP